MPEPVDLAYAVGLEPPAAVDYFRSKGYVITDEWWRLRQSAHAKAFTVARVARLDVLTDIREAVDQAMREGLTQRQFNTNLEPILRRKGWWGKETRTLADGTKEIVQLGSPRRLRTIYQTNLQTAYMAGRYRRQIENANARPYWQYLAIMDVRTRPTHARLHKRVFRFDDPIWQSLYPPNGWGCRCRVRALSQREVDAANLVIEESTGKLRESLELVSKRTGELRPVTGFDLGGGDTFKPDVGWSYNPGAAALSLDEQLWRRLATIEDDGLKAEVLRGVINHTDRRNAYEHFVDRVLDHGQRNGEVWPIGFLSDGTLSALHQRDIEPTTGVVVINDKQLQHANRDIHTQKKDNALSREQYKSLPDIIANPMAVLYDKGHDALLYVAPGDPRLPKLVVQMDYALKKHGQTNLVSTAYTVAIEDLTSGPYDVIEGALE